MAGRPCIWGARVTVNMIVGQIASGVTIEDLLEDYPYLERADIQQALRFAIQAPRWRVRTLPL
jgi:uncharacterized protein (DUF433 family)